MELIPGIGMYTLNKLLVHTQPAHLAVAEGLALGDPALALRRAAHVRRVLEDEAGRPR
jgi:protein-arginine kinase